MNEPSYLSHREQMEAHRAAFNEWWLSMLAGPFSDSHHSKREQQKLMDWAWAGWLHGARVKLDREKARVM